LRKQWIITVEREKGKNRRWLLETSIHEEAKKGEKIDLFQIYVFSPKIDHFENISISYLPLFNSVAE
jgi:hypothetical protein